MYGITSKFMKQCKNVITYSAGEAGDRVQFSEMIIANVRLYALRNERTLSTKAVANFTRQQLATALRQVSRFVTY